MACTPTEIPRLLAGEAEPFPFGRRGEQPGGPHIKNIKATKSVKPPDQAHPVGELPDSPAARNYAIGEQGQTVLERASADPVRR